MPAQQAAVAAAAGVKRKRKLLTDYHKIWAAKYKLKFKASVDAVRDAMRLEFEELADPAEWKLPKNTLSAFLSDKTVHEWANKELSLKKKVVTKARQPAHPVLERALSLWFVDMTEARGLNVAGTALPQYCRTLQTFITGTH